MKKIGKSISFVSLAFLLLGSFSGIFLAGCGNDTTTLIVDYVDITPNATVYAALGYQKDALLNLIPHDELITTGYDITGENSLSFSVEMNDDRADVYLSIIEDTNSSNTINNNDYMLPFFRVPLERGGEIVISEITADFLNPTGVPADPYQGFIIDDVNRSPFTLNIKKGLLEVEEVFPDTPVYFLVSTTGADLSLGGANLGYRIKICDPILLDEIVLYIDDLLSVWMYIFHDRNGNGIADSGDIASEPDWTTVSVIFDTTASDNGSIWFSTEIP